MKLKSFLKLKTFVQTQKKTTLTKQKKVQGQKKSWEVLKNLEKIGTSLRQRLFEMKNKKDEIM